MGYISAQQTRYSHLMSCLFLLAILLFSAGSVNAGTVINQCDDCHGMPPSDGMRKGNPNFRSYSSATSGNHLSHLGDAPAALDCSICHAPIASNAYGHQNDVINMANSIKGYSTATKRAKYNKGVFFNQTSVPFLSNATCSNVNCHFETTTSTWGTTPFSTTNDCSACHSVPGTSAPHTTHEGYYSFASNGCNHCHSDYLTSLNFSHATSAGGRGIHVVLDNGAYTGSGLNYLPSQSASRSFGSCNSNYCHSNGKGGAPNVTATWGGSVTLDCGGCHGIATSGGAAALSGRHDKHVNNAAYLGSNFVCVDCHARTVSDNSTILDKSLHINSFIDYSGLKAGRNYSDCSNIYCHSDGKGTHVNPGLWTAAPRTPDCKLCHGSKTVAQGAAFESVAGEPNYTNGGQGAAQANSHEKHTVIGSGSCVYCHSSTTSTGTAIQAGSITHIDGDSTVVQGGGKSFNYQSADKSCSTSSCHSGGGIIANPPLARWGATFSCTGCHGDATSGTLSGEHTAHVNNAAVIGTNFGCVECHAKTVSNNTTIGTPGNHLNSFVDYSGSRAGKSSTYVTASGVCSASYCHSDGKGTQINMTAATWRGSATLGCNGCHGTTNGLGAPDYTSGAAGSATANSHNKHIAAGAASCSICHSATTLTGTTIAAGSSSHIDRAFTVGTNGTIAVTYAPDTKTCSTTYCHSAVQAPGGGATAPVYGAPVWGGGAMNCTSCHSNMSNLTEADTLDPAKAVGSHKRHVTDAGFSCSLCHGADYSPTTTGPLHADGTINVEFTAKGKGTTYSQATGNVPGNGYGTCSTSKCHGRGTRNWGLNTSSPECEKCHGSANTAQTTGTFKDTAGGTGSAYVGTHVSHLAGIHNYSAPITCNQCHIVPTSVASFGHMTSLPARLNFGPLANMSSHARGQATKTTMSPTYAASSCSNTYCHAGMRYYSAGTYTPQGASPTPVWGDPAYLGSSGCNKCHGYPPAGPAGSEHSTSTNCNACHSHVAASNIAFNDKTKHIDGIVQTTKDECLGCHSTTNACVAGDPSCVAQKLVGAHISHTDADLFLVGKKLSTGDYTDQTWIYSIQYVNGFPKYGCGFCHPMDAGTHKNSVIELDMDPTHSQAGTVKTKNKAGGPWIASRVTGTNVVCSNVYCHSNGFMSGTPSSYQYRNTPDWYATAPWTAVDKCSQCHGNSPNSGGSVGSPAHAKHVVANHYKNIFSNYSGKLPEAGVVGSGSVHGDPATSTTFNCNVCHYATVKVSFNDKGSVCNSCHVASGSAPLKGSLDVDTTNTKHVNGVVDVVFMDPFVIKSKAQLRDSITTVSQLNSSWIRVKGFKTFSSHDLSRTTPQYTAGTCSTVACHNGTHMEWSTPGPLLCAACHVDLPQ